MTYASKTTVPAERSRAEVEKLLYRYGADRFGYMNVRNRVEIAFMIDGRAIKMELPFADPDDRQDVNRRWRCLLLVLKAKLVAVEDGISTIEREFLADMVMADGRSVGQFLAPQLAKARGMPLMLKEAGDE